MQRLTIYVMLAAMGFGMATAAHAAGDAARGSKYFDEECSDCHSLKEGKNKKGPSLHGIVGRKSASIADFKYSDAMQAHNVTWSAETIDPYIQAPKKVVPGGKMKYDGLDDAAARQDIITFLSSQH